MLGTFRTFGELYATNVIYFVSYYIACFNKFLETVDFMPIYDNFVYLSASIFMYFFPDVEYLYSLDQYYETFIVFPFVGLYKAAVYLVKAYFACFEVDFIIQLDRGLRVALCRLLDKPHCENKSLLYTLFEARPLTRRGFTRSSLLAEVYYVFCLFFTPTFILFVFFYYVFFIISILVLVISFITAPFFDDSACADDRAANSTYLAESEKELGAVDDFLFVFLSLCVVYALYAGFFFFYSFGIENMLFVISTFGFPLLIITAFSLPVNFLWDCGVGFVAYLRGSGNTTFFALEFMYDTLAVAIMFIRLSIQNVRFLLILFAYFEMFEYLDGLYLLNERSWAFFQALYSNLQTASTTSSALYIVLLSFPAAVIHAIYILVHLFYTFFSNFTCYIVLLFWFFSFLYTMFYNETMEKLLAKKRASYERMVNNCF